MKRTRWTGVKAAVLALLGLQLGGMPSAGAESIVTGGKTGTYYAIGNNLRDFVAPALEVKDSKGSWANVEELSQTKGVTLAIVQSDVYAAFVELRDSPAVPDATRREYGRLLANLRVFMPLYQEEVHFLVRKDDPIEFVHQIKGKQIWMDEEKSGTFLTALNIYGKMFQERPRSVKPFVNPTVIADDEGTRKRRSALMALSDPSYYAKYPQVDVVVLVGGQPLGLLQTVIPGNLKLLKFDPGQPNAARVLEEYKRAEIAPASYPLLNMAGAASPSLAVDSYLVTANFADPQRNEFIKEFANGFCTNVNVLRERGHKKWQALTWQPGSPLPPVAAGWRYSDYVKTRLSTCRTTCTPQEIVSKTCNK